MTIKELEHRLFDAEYAVTALEVAAARSGSVNTVRRIDRMLEQLRQFTEASQAVVHERYDQLTKGRS